MNLLMLTSSVSRRAGGLFDVVRNLSQAVHATRRHVVKVFGIRDGDTDQDHDSWKDIPVTVFDGVGSSAFSFAPGLARALCSLQPDLLHVHGLWMYPSIASMRWARQGRPYLVTPHGMLDPWALNNSPWKKRMAGMLYENRHLHRAACVHALNYEEAEAFRSYGLRNPICVIPNGVNLPADVPSAPPAWAEISDPDARVLFYLGRLHPKKGLEPLVWAWSQVEREARASGWHLVIGGWDQGGHEAHLKRVCGTLGLNDTIHFIGPQFGEAKAACLQAAAAFILPSFSEGLPMTVLEAWACGLPVLMTSQCNLPRGFEAGAALRIQPETESITAQLRRLFEMQETDREAMGKRGRALVERDHQWPVVAAKMIEVYEWVLGKGPKPDVVLT